MMEWWMTEEVLWKANQTPLGSNQPDPRKVSPSSFMSQDGCLRTRFAADCTTRESIKWRQASGGGTHGGAPSPLTMKRRQYTGKQQRTPKTEKMKNWLLVKKQKLLIALSPCEVKSWITKTLKFPQVEKEADRARFLKKTKTTIASILRTFTQGAKSWHSRTL